MKGRTIILALVIAGTAVGMAGCAAFPSPQTSGRDGADIGSSAGQTRVATAAVVDSGGTPATRASAKRASAVSLADIDALIARLEAAPDLMRALSELAESMSLPDRRVAYITRLSELMRHHLAAEVRTLVEMKDPESAARAVELLNFCDGLNQFLADALAEPAGDARDRTLAWALRPDHVEITALACGSDPAARSEAVLRMTGIKDAEADAILARLIDDPDREVALQAMEAAGGRDPGAALVDALWKKAIVLPARAMGYTQLALSAGGEEALPRRETRVVKVHGREVTVAPDYSDISMRSADSEVAVGVLLGFRSPLVEDKLVEFMTRTAAGAQGLDSRATMSRMLSTSYGGGVAPNMVVLLEGYRPKGVVRPLVEGLIAMPADGSTVQLNGQKYRMGSRPEALAVLLDIVGEDKANYGLARVPGWGNRWVITGAEKEEEAALKRLSAWWQEHYREYGADSGKLPEASPTSGPYMRRGGMIVD